MRSISTPLTLTTWHPSPTTTVRLLRLPHLLAQPVDQSVRLRSLHPLVVIAGVVVSAELAPVVHGDVLHADQRLALLVPLYASLLALVATGHHRQPAQDREDAVLLADVVGAQAEALLSAQEGVVALLPELRAVHQVAEELPAGRHLVGLHAASGAHHVQRRGGGHRSRARLQPLSEVGDAATPRRHHRQRVGGRDEEPVSQDHRSIRIAICTSPPRSSPTRCTPERRLRGGRWNSFAQ